MAAAVCLAQAPSREGLKPLEVKVPSRRQPVSYAKEISALLEERCTGCHGTALAENRLNLETVSGMHKGGKRGPAIVAGDASKSLLFRMAAHQVEPAMPPRDRLANKPLAAQELGLLKLWIDAGAVDDSADQADALKSREAHARVIELGELPPGVQPINAVDLTADGARVVAGRANVVQIYDVDSGLEVITLGGHRDLIQSVRFSPDATMLAAGSYRIVTIWRAPTGAIGKTLTGHKGPVLSLAVGGDGTVYSGGQDGTIRLWDTRDGKALKVLSQSAPVTALAVPRIPQTILTGGGDGLVRWLDARDGRERMALKGHSGPVHDLGVLERSEDNRERVVSVAEDGTVRVRTLAAAVAAKAGPGAAKSAEAERILRGHKGPVRALAITPDGKTVLTAGDDATIRLWSARDGSPVKVLSGLHAAPIVAVAVSPDGKVFLTGAADGSARVCALSNGKIMRTLTPAPSPRPVRSVAFAPGGDRVATAGSEAGIKVWETETGLGVIAFGHAAPAGTAREPINKVAFTADGSFISASGDGSVKTWSFAGSWAEHKTLDSHTFRILALDFSPDGKLLATGGGEPTHSGEVKIWEAGKGLLARALDSLHSDTVFSLRFSPDGCKLASASADKFLKVTSVASGKLLRSFEGHTHHVMAVDWSSDGKQLVSGGADNVLKVWDFESGDQLRTLEGASKQVTSLRWIAARPEAAAASGDTQVRLWNTESGGIVRGFGGPTDYVYSLAASADGSRVAAGGAESIVFVWDGRSGQLVRKIEPPRGAPHGRSSGAPAG
jgi:WD40 repeat protein